MILKPESKNPKFCYELVSIWLGLGRWLNQVLSHVSAISTQTTLRDPSTPPGQTTLQYFYFKITYYFSSVYLTRSSLLRSRRYNSWADFSQNRMTSLACRIESLELSNPPCLFGTPAGRPDSERFICKSRRKQDLRGIHSRSCTYGSNLGHVLCCKILIMTGPIRAIAVLRNMTSMS